MTQTVDFQKAFSQAAGGVAAMGLMLVDFQRDAERAYKDENEDEDVRQAAKGAIVLANMCREMISELLTSLREPLLDGAPDYLKDALSQKMDEIIALRKEQE